jgi:hypothetical protein
MGQVQFFDFQVATRDIEGLMLEETQLNQC